MRVTVKPGDSLPEGKTDWARLEVHDRRGNSGRRAVPIPMRNRCPANNSQRCAVYRASKCCGAVSAMTQAEFAQAFHLPITTLRDWEQRRSVPDAPARALLLAIERDPEVMRRLPGVVALSPMRDVVRRCRLPEAMRPYPTTERAFKSGSV